MKRTSSAKSITKILDDFHFMGLKEKSSKEENVHKKQKTKDKKAGPALLGVQIPFIEVTNDNNHVHQSKLKSEKNCFHNEYKFLTLPDPNNKDQTSVISFNDFKIVKKLGSGTFGKVFLASHKITMESVVIKVLEKRLIAKYGQEEHVMLEKKVLELLSQTNEDKEDSKELSYKKSFKKPNQCPFTIQPLCSFQDTEKLYFVTEHCSGGELFAHLKAARHGRFSEHRAKFYAAELLCCLRYMHEEMNIVYRDIKPENILLDKRGNVKLCDFGFAKLMKPATNGQLCKTYTFVGTDDYLAPEIINGSGYSYEADLWSVGVLIYELTTGEAPFRTYDNYKNCSDYQDILSGSFRLPSHLSPQCKDLLISILKVDRRHRIGSTGGIKEVMNHPWFKDIDFKALLEGNVKPPKLHKYKKGLVDVQGDDVPVDNDAGHYACKRYENFAFNKAKVKSHADSEESDNVQSINAMEQMELRISADEIHPVNLSPAFELGLELSDSEESETSESGTFTQYIEAN